MPVGPSPKIRFSLCTEKLYTFSTDCENSTLVSDCADTHTPFYTVTLKHLNGTKKCVFVLKEMFYVSKDVAAFKNVNVFQ